MFALLSTRLSGIALPTTLLWLFLCLTTTAAAHPASEPACLTPTESDPGITADPTPVPADAGATPELTVDDRSEPVALPSLLVLERLPVKSTASFPTENHQRRKYGHSKAWPQAPPDGSVTLFA
ncbi:MAG TPA: hypothetical protein VFN16_07260 [Saccharospirillum sp.]|nr:hypothetical protein [Saccharospirillum sp.]